jgi:G6PDH family F420-dependent oxidoreductase
VQIGAAVSGPDSIARFAALADHLVAVEPDADAVRAWDEARSSDLPASRKIGQVPICWDRDEERAVARAHEQFRWFAGGWKVNADLPTTEAFEAASQFVRPEDVSQQITCGPDLDAIVESVSAYWEAGFTDVAIVQVGDEGQDEFLSSAAGPLLEKLRAAAPTG